ncbi:S8 family serine peptidase [Hymenobacter saemangeumensis]
MKYLQLAGLLLCGGLLTAPAAAQGPATSRAASPGKLAPGLLAAQHGRRMVRVSVSDPVAFTAWLSQHLPGRQLRKTGSAAVLQLSGIGAADLPTLAACPWVEFVDVGDRPAHEERRVSFLDLAANAVTAVHARFPQLSGRGLTLSVKEQQFNANDIDFRGRVLPTPALRNPVTDHATIMATIAAGGGNSGVQGKGAAWQARLVSSDFARLQPDEGSQLAAAGVTVQNHSYGVGIENYYGLDAQGYDQQARDYPELLHVFSAGNVGSQASANNAYAGIAGFANLTGQFKMAKNTLSVGATNALSQVPAQSSRGPAYDGRVKPELVAYGDGGTSEAAALVSGISLLLQQAYREQYNALPTAALVKAALLNSADDLGRPAVDFVHGFGNADALGALQTIRDNRVVNGTIANNASSQILRIAVPPGQQELKATLAWTDPAASANAARALVNDLDLELIHLATGQRWQPWVLSSYPHADSLARPARRGADHLNNVEQITLALPQAGTYELHVRGYSVAQGPQAYGLAYEFSPVSLTWLRPLESQNLLPEATSILRWQWNGPPAAAALQYRPLGSGSWRQIAPAVPLSQQLYVWTVPDTTTLAELRLVPAAGGAAYATGAFSILQPPRVGVGYTCPGETLLQWNAVPGAAEYQVYQLGATRLEPLLRTQDTTLLLNAAQLQSLYYAVAPVVQGRLLESGPTSNYTEQGTACYFRSFRVRQLVEDTIHFDVELGTVARLQSATLERLGPAGYQAVQTLSPVPRPAFAFSDLPAVSDRYLYRVRLQTVGGQSIYSSAEEAYRVQPGSLLAFPNPVVPGQALHLIGSSGAILHVQVFDALGRLVRETSGDGVVNEVPTGGLQKGLYLLRVFPTGQQSQTLRVVVLE